MSVLTWVLLSPLILLWLAGMRATAASCYYDIRGDTNTLGTLVCALAAGLLVGSFAGFCFLYAKHRDTISDKTGGARDKANAVLSKWNRRLPDLDKLMETILGRDPTP